MKALTLSFDRCGQRIHGAADVEYFGGYWAVVKECPLNVQWAEYGATGNGTTDVWLP